MGYLADFDHLVGRFLPPVPYPGVLAVGVDLRREPSTSGPHGGGRCDCSSYGRCHGRDPPCSRARASKVGALPTREFFRTAILAAFSAGVGGLAGRGGSIASESSEKAWDRLLRSPASRLKLPARTKPPSPRVRVFCDTPRPAWLVACGGLGKMRHHTSLCDGCNRCRGSFLILRLLPDHNAGSTGTQSEPCVAASRETSSRSGWSTCPGRNSRPCH